MSKVVGIMKKVVDPIKMEMSKVVAIMKKVVDLDMVSNVLALFTTHFANICSSPPFVKIRILSFDLIHYLFSFATRFWLRSIICLTRASM